MTHELRVQGEALGGALNWMVGGYYSTEDITQVVNAGLGADYDRLAGALLAAVSSGGTFDPTSDFYLGEQAATPLQALTGVDPASVRSTNIYEQKSKSWSIFTHNTLEVAQGLKLTVGLRYSDESKDGSFTQTSINNNLCPAMMGQIGAGNVPPPTTLFGQTAFVLGCFPFTAPAI